MESESIGVIYLMAGKNDSCSLLNEERCDIKNVEVILSDNPELNTEHNLNAPTEYEKLLNTGCHKETLPITNNIKVTEPTETNITPTVCHPIDAVYNNQTFPDKIIYFNCKMCPFICTQSEKINDHVERAHPNFETEQKHILKCPGCPNIFYHAESIKIHLLKDHEVDDSDVSDMISCINYFANKKFEEDKLLSHSDDSTVSGIKDKFAGATSNPFCMKGITTNITSVTLQQKVNKAVGNKIKEAFLSVPVSYEFQANLEQETKTKLTNASGNNFNYSTKKQKILKTAEKSENKKRCLISGCMVQLKDFNNLEYHIKCHLKTGFQCPECSSTFKGWNALAGHLWNIHKIDMELYACDRCNYKTFNLARLNNTHKLIHGDEKPFLCDHCGRGFKNQRQLRNHKYFHKPKSAEKLRKCSICDCTFSSNRLLRIHFNTVHKKVKPFLCNYCGYKTGTKSSLQTHVRQHTGEKPFKCDSCDYSSSDHNSLRKHKMRHTGVKPYKCEYCSYACIQSSTYKVHLKTKHPTVEQFHMHICPMCQFRTMNKHNYQLHVATHKDLDVKHKNIIRKTLEESENKVDVIKENEEVK